MMIHGLISDVLPGLPTVFGLGILEVMGLLALGILWVNMGLLALVAFKRIAPIVRRTRGLGPVVGGGRGHAQLRAGGRILVHGHVSRPTEPNSSDALAFHRVEQTGRSAGVGQVFFHDRSYTGELLGGAIEVETEVGPVRIHLPATSEFAEVWPSRSRSVQAASQMPAEVDFAATEAQARRASGYRRQLCTPINPGDAVWVSAVLAPVEDGETDLQVLSPRNHNDEIIVSAIEPRRWATRSSTICMGFGVATLVVTAVCTVLALWPPVFGTVSMVGAMAAMAALLSNMLFGNLVRDAVLAPSKRIIGGTWSKREEP